MQPVVNSFNRTIFFQLFEHTKLKTLGIGCIEKVKQPAFRL